MDDRHGVRTEDPELTALDASRIATMVHDGLTSAVAVAQAHLDRIAEADATLAAFQQVIPERVLAEAAAVDSRPDRFALPLAGVPVAVADSIDVSGYPTRHGSTATPTNPVRRDDELVRRLRGAGAVVIGKTRLSELSCWGFTQAAAALDAGMAVLALDTDSGGQVRIPAADRGLVGLKPGRDVLPPPGGGDRQLGLREPGLLARSAPDAALMFGVLAGLSPTTVPAPRDVALSLRSPFPVGRLHPDHRAAAVAAADRLREHGAVVTEDDPPYPWGLSGEWTRRWQAGAAQDAAALDLDPEVLDERTAAVVRRGLRVLRSGPLDDRPAQRWQERFLDWLGGHDLVVGPATAAGPPGQPGDARYLPSLLRTAARTPYTPAWNVAGLPALVVPVDVEGRPIGVQLIGRPGDEFRLLGAAELISPGSARDR